MDAQPQHPPTLILQSSSGSMDAIAREVLTPHFPKVLFHSTDPGDESRFLAAAHRLDEWSLRAFPWRGAIFRQLRIPLRRWVRGWKWRLFAPTRPADREDVVVTMPVPSKDALDWWWDRELDLEVDFRSDLDALRYYVASGSGRSCSPDYLDRVIVVRRPRHPSQNRVLVNDSQLADTLTRCGTPAVVYEPGAHSFRCQVEVFKRATGIVGWRGAEFANILWCEQRIPIIFFQLWRLHGVDPPQELLGDLLGQPVTVVSRLEPDFRVEAEEILGFLNAEY